MAHRSKEFDSLLGELIKRDFRVEKSTHGIKIYSPDKSIAPRATHPDEKAIHPLRRWIKNVCKINL